MWLCSCSTSIIEDLDPSAHLDIFDHTGSLQRVVSNYLEHYHQERNHQGKENLLLFPARVGDASSRGAIRCRERLGAYSSITAAPHDYFYHTGSERCLALLLINEV
jgi:hypothetical protein